MNGVKETKARRNHGRADAARRARLKSVAAVCLPAFVLLAVAVTHSQGPYAFEGGATDWLGPPSAIQTWVDIVGILAGPAIGVVLVVSVVFGYIKRVLRRVVAYAALAAATLFLSEDVAKPLVHRVWQGLLTFPSGHVTAVSATALAMWLALLPVLGTRARSVTFALGTAWTVLMFVAVVGARWHTPVDGVGSLLLSVGTVTAGAVVLESFLPPGRSKGMPTTSRSRATHPRTPKALTTRKR